MSKIFNKTVLTLLTLAGLLSSVSADGLGNKTLSGHVPAAVSHLTATGRLPGTNILHLAIGLPVRNQAALTARLQQVTDPSSPNYRHYLTPDEFVAQFGPTTNDYQAVINFAHTNGFILTKTHGNRMLVDVNARVSDVERAFHVQMQTFHHPQDARDFYSPATEPSVDAGLPILTAQGMNSYLLPKPLSQKKAVSTAQPARGSGPFGGYMGKDFRTAYLPGGSLNGSGQIVGLLQFDGYFTSDILTYEGLAGLTNVPLQNVLLDGFDGTPGSANDEVCLDIEACISMAPALAKVVVFEGGPFGNPNDILSSMAASNTIKQFSASWAYGTDGTTEQLYQQLALQGQTFLNASGDGDAWVGGIPWGALESPNITLVGGTTLTMNGNAASYASEKVWNWGLSGPNAFNPDGYWGSSGGISTDVLIPSWQQNISMANNNGSTTFRNTPDVALTADNVFVVSSGGSYGIFGGTSCASPLFAGFMALVNQQAAINNDSSVGFLAPQVYALANTTNYALAFHDIVRGDNTWDQSLTNYFAVTGYDLATGLGTPNGTNFINILAPSNAAPVNILPLIISAPTGPWGTNMAVFNGSNPNGPWFLFVQDDTPLNAGMISNGWYLTLTTANPVGEPADNAVFASATNVTIPYGTNFTLTVSVTNFGPSASSNVLVTDTLPLALSNLPLVSSNLTTGTLTPFGSVLTWSVGNLATNTGATLTLVFHGIVSGIYTNTATVSSASADPNPDDDTVVSFITVSLPPPPPVVSNFLLPTGSKSFQLSVNGNAVPTVVQASTNLINWVNVFTSTPPFTYTNFGTTNYPMRFYRAVIGP